MSYVSTRLAQLTRDHARVSELPLIPDGSWAYRAAPQGEELFAFTIEIAG